mmetsp:Transcript_14478/g.36626  ORF Transcript_14478/g.36626 Transcript_14478/m.36626 type:complete len:320 (-) Transcript_14478:304-1263(-)
MRSQFLAILCLAAAITCLLSALPGNAFTPGIAVPQVTRGASSAGVAQPILVAGLPHAAGSSSLAAGLRNLACAASLLLLASSRRGAKCNAVGKRRRAKVVCGAARLPSTPVTARAHEVLRGPCTTAGRSPSAQLNVFDDVTPALVVPTSVSFGMNAKVVTASFAPNPDSDACPASSSSPASARCPGSAKFVGGARCSQRRARSDRGAAAARRASRRVVGSQLQAETIVEQHPVEPSFDPSRLRKKIQLGLQVPTCMRSARSRESKTSSSAKGCSFTFGLYVEAMHSKSQDRQTEEPMMTCKRTCQLGTPGRRCEVLAWS